MAIQQYSLKEIVDGSVANRFGMPEFQRGFVWIPEKVKEFVESLHDEYPVGAMLFWKQQAGEPPAEGRTNDASQPVVWIVDGQQRTTSLCLLFGRQPYWWQDNGHDWKTALEKYDIRVNPLDPKEVKFEVPKRAIVRNNDFVSLRTVLTADDNATLREIANAMKERHSETQEFADAIYDTLSELRNIRSRQITAFEEDKGLEDVVEIFVRLNQAGTKVTEGDIVKALVAGKNRGWTNDTFQPFLNDLEETGFDLDPVLIYRSLIAMETGNTRFKDVDDDADFWASHNLNANWPKVSDAWRTVISGLCNHGILNSDLLPSKNALIPLVVMAATFGKDFRIGPGLAWLLRATCTNRYSRTTDTRLAEDISPLRETGTDFKTAVKKAMDKLDELDFTAGDNEFFKKSYRDGGARLMLYLLSYDRQAKDWGESQERIGFSGTDLLQKFNPDWHHIFPRAYLKGKLPTESDRDCVANVVSIRKETNLKIGKKPPAEYMKEISEARLAEQHVPTDRSLFALERYNEFLDRRAEMLAKAANEFMKKLSKGYT